MRTGNVVAEPYQQQNPIALLAKLMAAVFWPIGVRKKFLKVSFLRGNFCKVFEKN